jgi:hypothetical protein
MSSTLRSWPANSVSPRTPRRPSLIPVRPI